MPGSTAGGTLEPDYRTFIAIPRLGILFHAAQKPFLPITHDDDPSCRTTFAQT
jgi:hypothetical protein